MCPAATVVEEAPEGCAQVTAGDKKSCKRKKKENEIKKWPGILDREFHEGLRHRYLQQVSKILVSKASRAGLR